MMADEGRRPQGRALAWLPLLLLACLALASARGAGGQDSTGGQGGGEEPLLSFQDEVAVGMVLVPVVIRARDGFLDDLPRSAFQLFVDDRPVPIESFESRGEGPVSLIFLQDLSGSMGNGGKLEASRQAVIHFVNNYRPGDELAISAFADGSTWVEVPFTGDRSALAEAVARWQAYGVTALHDAVAWLPEIGLAGRHPRRAAVLLTDGVDNASSIEPAEARALVRQAELPVYVLGFGSGDPYQLGPEGEKLYRYADLLNLLARLTGGEYFPVAGPIDLKEALVTISEELRHQYVLGFSPGYRGFGDHDIRVEVATGRRRRVSISSRLGYNGAAPQAHMPPP